MDNYEEHEHPRDKEGQWITKGAHLKITRPGEKPWHGRAQEDTDGRAETINVVDRLGKSHVVDSRYVEASEARALLPDREKVEAAPKKQVDLPKPEEYEKPEVFDLSTREKQELEAESVKMGLGREFTDMIRRGELQNALRNVDNRALYAKGADDPIQRKNLRARLAGLIAERALTGTPEQKSEREQRWRVWDSGKENPRYGDPKYEKAARASRESTLRQGKKLGLPDYILDMVDAGDDVGALAETYRYMDRMKRERNDLPPAERQAEINRAGKLFQVRRGIRYRVENPNAKVMTVPPKGQGVSSDYKESFRQRRAMREAGVPIPEKELKESTVKNYKRSDKSVANLSRLHGMPDVAEAVDSKDYRTALERARAFEAKLKAERAAIPDSQIDFENANANENRRAEIRRELTFVNVVKKSLEYRIDNPDGDLIEARTPRRPQTLQEKRASTEAMLRAATAEQLDDDIKAAISAENWVEAERLINAARGAISTVGIAKGPQWDETMRRKRRIIKLLNQVRWRISNPDEQVKTGPVQRPVTASVFVLTDELMMDFADMMGAPMALN